MKTFWNERMKDFLIGVMEDAVLFIKIVFVVFFVLFLLDFVHNL